MDLMFQPLRKYADFTGRARRMELWLFWLLLIGIQIVFSILIGLVAGPTAAVADPTDPFAVLNGPAKALYGVFFLMMLALLIPSLAGIHSPAARHQPHRLVAAAWAYPIPRRAGAADLLPAGRHAWPQQVRPRSEGSGLGRRGVTGDPAGREPRRTPCRRQAGTVAAKVTFSSATSANTRPPASPMNRWT